MFCLGICCTGRWNVTYIFLTEFITEAKFKVYAPWLNVTAAFPIILSSITFQFITKYTIYFEIFALITTVLAALACLILIPETPKFLIGWKRFDEARKSLSYIAQFNRSPDSNFEGFGFQTEAVNQSDVRSSLGQPLIDTAVNESGSPEKNLEEL